jgi:hypothetical protein
MARAKTHTQAAVTELYAHLADDLARAVAESVAESEKGALV